MNDNMLEIGNGGAPAPSEVPTNREQEGEVGPMLQQGEPQNPSDMLQHFGSVQDQAAARFQKMKQATSTLAKVRTELDGLVALGDTLTQEDVTKAGGGLVAAGLSSVGVAGLLADMPQSGEPLQAWVAQHDVQTRQREQQAQQALAITRHEMGLTAFRHLVAHGAEGAGQGQQPADAQPPVNPMELGNQESPNAG